MKPSGVTTDWKQTKKTGTTNYPMTLFNRKTKQKIKVENEDQAKQWREKGFD